MIMSPFVLVRNVPLIGPPRGGQIEADSDEPQGVGTGASAGAGARQTVAGRGCRSTATRELPAGEAAVDARGGFVEPGEETPGPLSSARAQGAFRGDGADGRELSRLAGGARPPRLLDRPGR